jgi:formamidopyrimidine-DNA glycosylase
MPEGVEVAIQSEKISKICSKSKKVVSFSYDDKDYIHKKVKNIPNCPLFYQNVFSRGKLIIFEFKGLYLVSHLGMSGYWGEEKDKYCKFEIHFDNVNLYFSDIRKIGTSLTFTSSLDDFFKKNGPCLMSAAKVKYGYINSEKLNQNQKIATLDIWNKCISNTRIKNKPVAEFLLEQKYVSGIGNYLRAEILYSSKIHPERELKNLSSEEKELLFNKTLEIMFQSYIHKGPKRGYILDGNFNLQVYGRKYDDFENKVICYEDKKKRTVHYVPEVQK